MKYFTAIFFLSIAAMACNKAGKSVQKFSWLNGHWYMKDSSGTTTEEWAQKTDSLMEGKSDFIKGDTVMPFETIRLFLKDTSFYYEAKAAGQNNEQPVVFRITNYGDSGFTAENPAHDFPKRIVYQLVNRDSIHAFVDGGAADPEKRADFYYTRKK